VYKKTQTIENNTCAWIVVVKVIVPSFEIKTN
jgi:hypothetical protein